MRYGQCLNDRSLPADSPLDRRYQKPANLCQVAPLTILAVTCVTMIALLSTTARKLGRWAVALWITLAALSTVGLAVLVDRGEATASSLLIHTAGTVALLIGFVAVAARRRPKPRRPRPVKGSFDQHYLALMMVIGVGVALQLVTEGVPTLASNPEVARWGEAQDRALGGIPARLSLIGLPVALGVGITRLNLMGPATSRLFRAFLVLGVLYTAGLGFRSALLELALFLAITYGAATKLTFTARSVLGACLAFGVGVGLFAYLSASYTSDTAQAQNRGGLVGALTERSTAGTARSAAVLLGSDPERLGYSAPGPQILTDDMLSLLSQYMGGEPDGNRLNERISAVVAGKSPNSPVRGTIAPATPGLVAVLLFALPTALAIPVLMLCGMLYRMTLLALRRASSFNQLLVSVALAYFGLQVVFKGNLEFQFVNVVATTILLIVVNRVLKPLSTRTPMLVAPVSRSVGP